MTTNPPRRGGFVRFYEGIMPRKNPDWTLEEDGFLLEHYSYGKANFCSKSLGRSLYAVHTRAKNIGVAGLQKRFTEEEKQTIRRMNACGCLDTEIAAALKRPITGPVSRMRKSMGLPCRYAANASRLGLRANETKRQRVRDFAAEYNLPTDLRLREVMIVVLLAHRPRLTPAQIADRMNITVGHLHSRLYLSGLKRRGLIYSVRVGLTHYYSITPECAVLLKAAGGDSHVGPDGRQTADAVEGLGEDEAAG